MVLDSKQKIDRIISEVIERRDQGEAVSDAEVIAEHRELADILEPRLKQLQLIDQARQIADQNVDGNTVSFAGATSNQPLSCKECGKTWNSTGEVLPADGKCPNCRSTLMNSGVGDFEIGQQIRQYKLLEKVGSGGFGSVWKARDSRLDCDVAIKIPHNEKLTADEIELFIREARVSARLRRHPNIVSVHEAEWDEAVAFISSDFIEGQTLRDRLANAAMDAREAADLVIILCDALNHAHESGIIHRDLKPENILLDHRNVPHVTDFGLAKQENQIDERETGRILGTIAYMSPEQAQGESQQADRRSDVFSLGVILYQMLTGERPFRGDAINLLRQIVDQNPPRPRTLDSRIPLDLETICLKCLEKHPDQRYQTMLELRDDLQRFQKHQPIIARPISASGQLWRWCKRHPVIPWLSLSLILVTLMSLIAAGILLEQEIAKMQDDAEEVMEGTLKFVGFHAAKDVELTLDEGFESVEALVISDRLGEAMANWKQLEKTNPGVRAESLEKLQALTGEKLVDAAFPDELKKIQDVLRDLRDESQSSLKTFSWFVTDDRGSQIARVEPKDPLGRPFSYRSYFTGTKEYPPDTPLIDISRPRSKRDWNQPRLSAVFETEDKDAIVVAISAPIWNPQKEEPDSFLGVAGVFIELGNLVEQPTDSNGRVGLVIYDIGREFDLREDRGRGLVIHHPELTGYFAENKSLGASPIELILPSANLELKQHPNGSDFRFLADYHDPILDPDSKMAWMAVRSATPIQERLYVVVQMPLSVIKEPGNRMRANLFFLGLALSAFASAILIPVWGVILRKVLKE